MEQATQVVRGRLTDELAAEVTAFWTDHGALDEAGARERLPEVVAVLRGTDGAIAGVSSVFVADLDLVGGRRFFVFRSFVPSGSTAPLIKATYAALDAEFDATDPETPVGLCVATTPAEAARRPEAQWQDPRLDFAGFLPDGRQVRVAYFHRASIVPGLPSGPADGYDLEAGPRIDLFAEQDAFGADDVVAFWLREGAMDETEARRRAAEVHLIAVDDADGIVGVGTAYVQHAPQLGLDMWFYRAFVGVAHRRSTTAARIMVNGRRILRERATQGAGIVIEVENPGLKRTLPEAHWLPTDFIFIGENARGDHVRVHYFDGATAPLAQGST